MTLCLKLFVTEKPDTDFTFKGNLYPRACGGLPAMWT